MMAGMTTPPMTPFQVPVRIPGTGVRLLAVPVEVDPRDFELTQQENARREGVALRRLVYDGDQYEEANAAIRERLIGLQELDPREPTPEQHRLHAYSTQVSESIDFMADRLGEGFTMTAEDATVQAVLDGMVAASEQLSAENDAGEQELTVDDTLRDSMVAGDVAAYVGYDPTAGTTFVELWESEFVDFRMKTTKVIEKVIRTMQVWVPDPDIQGAQRQVVQRMVYSMQPTGIAGPNGPVLECRADEYWDSDESPRDSRWLGVGRVPWQLLRCDPKGLRAVRGTSMITSQVISAARRYDSNEQHSWDTARYNSHGNVAVIGDAANLQLQRADGKIRKDVADVVTFPSGTALTTISLPTDDSMIEHQRKVLADGIYSKFGLVRVDMETITGLGGATGYALEILNEKTEATFRRIRRTFRKDWLNLCNLVLDVTAWLRDAVPVGLLADGTPVELPDPADVLAPVGADVVAVKPAWWLVDPMQVFPNRKIKVGMGTGYVVDEVMIRADVQAGLLSIQGGLRLRGWSEPDIKKNMDELAEERKAKQPVLNPFGAAGGQPGNTQQQGGANGRVRAGSSLNGAGPN
jgi:hypothetical protein